ncbi:MBL fold metallo-hydrolase [Amycolatopsis sp. CA-128772]|uniref:MBL fold metallo-hydrolase n=1 Tax=Amycolatopsis sp. CA-128772 TaxID=2073159 RepID=UPI000CD000B0|nr:MBL fold metallo-hydrolase [Amycolatopsis sp. CA-128772]
MPLDLIVLGSASSYPRPGEPCSGYLVRGGGATVWLDAGPGTLAALQQHTALTDVDAIWISHLHADHVADLLPGHFAEAGGLTLATTAAEHGFPAFGVRVTDGDRVLAYSGDTGPYAALTELAAGADLFLCEADVPAPSPVHLTPEDAARAGHAAGKLVLTHLGPFLDPAQAADRAGTDAVAKPGTVSEV